MNDWKRDAKTANSCQAADRLLTKALCSRHLAFNVLADDWFRAFVGFVSKGSYNLPSRSYITDKMLPMVVEEVRSNLFQRLYHKLPDGSTYIAPFAVGTDGWTSVSTDGVCGASGFNIQEVPGGLVYNVMCLGSTGMPASHSAANIAKAVEKIIKSGLPEELLECWKDFVISMTQDNAKAQTNSTEVLGLIGLACICHVLNLAVQDMLNQPPIKGQRTMYKHLHKKVKLSTKCTATLKEVGDIYVRQ